nr:hypothetical protein [uncultured Pseudomonas sp.]
MTATGSTAAATCTRACRGGVKVDSRVHSRSQRLLEFAAGRLGRAIRHFLGLWVTRLP